MNQPIANTIPASGGSIRGSLWFGAWCAYLGFEALVATIDWLLHSHLNSTQRSDVGISDLLYFSLGLGALVGLGIAAFYSTPRSWATWKRCSFSVLQLALGLVILLLAELTHSSLNGGAFP